ncbi:hypothetical protein EBR21_04945, partial [bacterium]|nr:hypothetical protein [bacterium]
MSGPLAELRSLGGKNMNPVLLSSGMIFAGMTLLWTVGACSKDVAVDSTPQWLASPGMTDAEIQKALKATMALRVNLTSNRATLYRKGEALQQWNIASADVTG